MLIDTEKNQKFLRLIFLIQGNNSPAVNNIWSAADEVLNKKVYRHNNKYSLQPENNIPKPRKKGGRPFTLTIEQEQQLFNWHAAGVSNYEIGRQLGICEGSVRRYLKLRGAANG